MINFDPEDQTSISRFILEQLPRHKQFVLATTDEQGRPWAVCLNLTVGDNLDIIWQSRHNTEHSRHISARPEVAVCIASETPPIGDFGFSARAHAYEVTAPAELARLLTIRFEQKHKPIPPLQEYQGEGVFRLYKAVIQAAWINDDRLVKTPVDLAKLRNQVK